MPQTVNQKHTVYQGRSDLESLLGSPLVEDWVKISEMVSFIVYFISVLFKTFNI